MRKGLLLQLFHRPDPVLGADELEVIQMLLQDHIRWATREMERRRVSETIIRTRMSAETAQRKIDLVLGSMR